MDMNALISSYWGMYAVQTVLHSLIASVLVDCALLAWNITNPRVRQRFRFMVILLPVAAFPIYQLLLPRRGDVYFRIESLLDSNRWFLLDLWGIPAFAVFVAVPALTSFIFIIQELVPIVSQMFEQMRRSDSPAAAEEEETMPAKVSKALEGLPFDEHSVEIVDDDDFVLFSSTGLKPRIYVSTGLIQSFGAEQLQAAFAHEIGHIRRSRKPLLIIAYILRVLMFYNPVAMLEFRKLAHEEEKVCDDIAVALTGKPGALAEAVEMLRPEPEDGDPAAGPRGVGELASAIEHHSHDALLKSRIQRIGRIGDDDPPWGVPYLVTLALIAGINYFVV